MLNKLKFGYTQHTPTLAKQKFGKTLVEFKFG